ncbi:hypothetical protein QP246_02375 [Aerococcus urinae]|uniref:hypothetical protein n=1 Tax=Aerococcus urinae TaxID=1376 RepID=UPI00254E864F|nr:hypothetical protein [Aerococcus urinae]MDK6688305.1 hypothetical protein [Aerococcus urinae]
MYVIKVGNFYVEGKDLYDRQVALNAHLGNAQFYGSDEFAQKELDAIGSGKIYEIKEVPADNAKCEYINSFFSSFVSCNGHSLDLPFSDMNHYQFCPFCGREIEWLEWESKDEQEKSSADEEVKDDK